MIFYIFFSLKQLDIENEKELLKYIIILFKEISNI